MKTPIPWLVASSAARLQTSLASFRPSADRALQNWAKENEANRRVLSHLGESHTRRRPLSVDLRVFSEGVWKKQSLCRLRFTPGNKWPLRRSFSSSPELVPCAEEEELQTQVSKKAKSRKEAAMPTVAQVRSAWPGLLVFFAKQIVARRSLSQVSGEAFSDVLASAFFQVQSISGVRRFWQELWDAVCQRAIALRSRLRPKDAALFLGLAVKAQKFLADASKPQLSEARFALLSQRHAAAVGVAADSLASHLQNCIHKRRAGEAASGEKGSEEVSTKEAAALSPFLISSAATSCRKLSSLSRHSALHEALASAAVASSFSSFGGFDLTAFVNAAADFPAESTLCLWPVLAPFLFAEIEAFNARAFERLAAAAEALVGAAGRRLHCEGGLSRQVLRLVAISPQRVCRLFVLQQQQFDRRRVNSATLLAALSRVQGFVRRYPELFASLLVGLRTQLLLSAVSLARLALHDGAVCKEGRREEEAELLAFDEALTAGDSLRLVFAADLCDSRDLALICKTLESSQTLQEADRRSAEALEAALSAPILEGVSASLEALSLALYENAFALKLPQGKAETGRLREPLALSLGRQTALVLSCREEDGLKAFRSSLSSLASVLRVVESLALSDAKTASADQLNLAAPLLAELLFRASVCCRRNAAEELNAFLAGEFFSFLSSLLLVARRRRESAFSEAALLAAESVLEVLSSNSAEFLAETPPSLLAVYARALWGASSFVNVCFRVEEADALRMRGVEGEPDGLLLSRSLRRRVARLAEAVALRAVEALGVCEKKDLQETPPPSQQHAPQLAALACSLAVLQSPAAAHAVAAIAAEFARRGELRLSASQTICLLEAFARVRLREERLLALVCRRLAEEFPRRAPSATEASAMSKAAFFLSCLEFTPPQIRARQLASSRPCDEEALAASANFFSLTTQALLPLFEKASKASPLDSLALSRLFLASALTDFRLFSQRPLAEKETARASAELEALGLRCCWEAQSLCQELRKRVLRTSSPEEFHRELPSFARRLDEARRE